MKLDTIVDWYRDLNDAQRKKLIIAGSAGAILLLVVIYSWWPASGPAVDLKPAQQLVKDMEAEAQRNPPPPAAPPANPDVPPPRAGKMPRNPS